MSQKQKKPLLVLIGFSLFAWAASFYALWHQTTLLTTFNAGEAFCNVNSYVSCDTVALSPYSNLFGIPLAAFAMAFYAVFFILSLSTYFAQLDKNYARVKMLSQWLFILSIVSLGFTLVYAYLSLVVIKSLCLSCTAIYTASIVLLLAAYQNKNNSKLISEEAEPQFSFGGGLLVTMAVVVVLNVFSHSFVRSAVSDQPQIDENTLSLYVAQHLNNPQKSFVLDGHPYAGPEDAKINVVVYSDYQCPYCKVASKIIPSISKAYPNSIKIVYKDFPLSSACNPSMSHQGHAFSCQSAKITRCVYEKDGNQAYIDIHKELFENQSSLGPDTLKRISEKFGLSGEDYEACLNNLDIHNGIVEQTKEAQAAGVNSTPSVYVNGRKLDSAINPQVFKATIEHYKNSMR